MLDPDGEVLRDEGGVPTWRIRHHDVEEFQEIMHRHGPWKGDLEIFIEAALEKRKRPLLATAKDVIDGAVDAMEAVAGPESAPAGICSACHRPAEHLVSLSTRGRRPTPPVCQDCMKKAVHLVKGKEPSKNRNNKSDQK